MKMKLGTMGLDWAQIGAMLAVEDDNKQVEFFKAFSKECNSWGTKHQVEMQLAAVNRALTTEEKQTLGETVHLSDKLVSE
jgi:hypothetical protein